MKKIPILFLKDDTTLIEMYCKYFEARGYSAIVIRGGEEGLQKAIDEGPSLVTFKSSLTTKGSTAHPPIIIFTYERSYEMVEDPKIMSAAMSSDVFAELENSLNPLLGQN